MNKDFITNIEAYYKYADSIAPGYGYDIVHHICTIIPDKVNSIDAYVKRSIRNEFYNRKSSFNRLYRPHFHEELQDIAEFEYKGTKYDSILLHKIFLEMEIEGYDLEVRVFKDCYLGSSVYNFSKQTKLNRQTITKICKFTQDEIIRRYTALDVE